VDSRADRTITLVSARDNPWLPGDAWAVPNRRTRFQDRFSHIEASKRVPINRKCGPGREPGEKSRPKRGLGDSAKPLRFPYSRFLHAPFSTSLNIHNPSIDLDIGEADVTDIVIASDACRPE
jgi:hypothetical protein